MVTNNKLEELVGKLTKKVADLEAGKSTQPNTMQGQGSGNGPMAWRRVAPKEGDPNEKTVGEKLFKYCSK